MTDRQRLISDIQAVGLFVDGRGNLYGERYAPCLNSADGMWQHPEELADLLLLAVETGVKTFLNVGTFNARTFNFMATFLAAAGATRCVTIDPLPHHFHRLAGFEYLPATTADFAGQEFDLVFIDGHHSYANAKADYENVGRHARLCAFHDIDDDFIRGDPTLDGGVCRYWQEVKPGRQVVEFVASGKPRPVMGIGVIVQ